jgi:hypothetical protein
MNSFHSYLSLPLFAVCGLLGVLPLAAQPVPVAQWSFDKIEQNTFIGSGSVPKLQPAKILGEVKVVPGKVGNAVSFVGEPLAQITIPLDLGAITQGVFSVEFWFRPGAAPSDYGVCIDSGNARGFSIRVNGARRILLSTDGVWNAITSEDKIPELTWAHVVVTIDTTTARLYLSGKEVGRVELKENLRLAPVVLVGARTIRSKLPDGTFKEETNQALSGDIDALKFYNRALTAAEIAAAAGAKPSR